MNGYVATRSASATKTDTPLIETPQAISVVTQDQIQAQGAQTVPQALRYTSGITTDQFGADLRFNHIYVRGFVADQYLDSLKLAEGSFAQAIIDPFNLERLEVVHGPASVLYGQGSPGGIVDMVSKRPTEDPYHEMFLTTGSYGRIQGGVDLSGPIDKNKEFLYRFTASGFDVGSQVDHTEYERQSIAPSLTWRPNSDTSITFLGTYQRDPKAGFLNELTPNGVGTLFPLPNGRFIPTSFYSGEPNVDKMERTLGTIGYLAEHRFDNVWTVRQNLRYMDIDTGIVTVFPFGALNPNLTLNRSAFGEQESLHTFQVDNQAEAKFATGPLLHTALLGIDYSNGQDEALISNGTASPINVLNPVYGTPVTLSPTTHSVQNFYQAGVYIQDQIQLDRWHALFGIRDDDAEARTDNFLPAFTSKMQNDRALTKRAGLLYKFDNGVAPYVQYTESFQPTVGTDIFGNTFKPTTGQQEEVGIKYQPNSKSLLTLAAFDLTQQNVKTADPNNALNSVQVGETRSRGIELEGKSEISRNLTVLASYTYLDDIMTQTSVASQVGKRPAGIPINSAAAWADYTFHGGRLDGFGFGGGIRYLGKSAGNLANTYFIPSTTLFDAALHYDLAGLDPRLEGFQLSINATNLFDKTYVQWCQDAGCYYGLRRQVLGTLRYRW